MLDEDVCSVLEDVVVLLGLAVGRIQNWRLQKPPLRSSSPVPWALTALKTNGLLQSPAQSIVQSSDVLVYPATLSSAQNVCMGPQALPTGDLGLGADHLTNCLVEDAVDIDGAKVRRPGDCHHGCFVKDSSVASRPGEFSRAGCNEDIFRQWIEWLQILAAHSRPEIAAPESDNCKRRKGRHPCHGGSVLRQVENQWFTIAELSARTCEGAGSARALNSTILDKLGFGEAILQLPHLVLCRTK